MGKKEEEDLYHKNLDPWCQLKFLFVYVFILVSDDKSEHETLAHTNGDMSCNYINNHQTGFKKF